MSSAFNPICAPEAEAFYQNALKESLDLDAMLVSEEEADALRGMDVAEEELQSLSDAIQHVRSSVQKVEPLLGEVVDWYKKSRDVVPEEKKVYIDEAVAHFLYCIIEIMYPRLSHESRAALFLECQGNEIDHYLHNYLIQRIGVPL